MFALALLAVLSTPGQAGLRCGNHVVSRGAPAVEVRARCGDPELIQTWVEQVTRIGPNAAVGRTISRQVEQWLLRREPELLPRVVTIRDGKVARVDTLSRQLAAGAPSDARCSSAAVGRGRLAIEVYLACGAPDQVDRSFDVRQAATGGGLVLERTDQLERWTYNRGPRRLLRVYEFRNGRLLRADTGGYGF